MFLESSGGSSLLTLIRGRLMFLLQGMLFATLHPSLPVTFARTCRLHVDVHLAHLAQAVETDTADLGIQWTVPKGSRRRQRRLDPPWSLPITKVVAWTAACDLSFSASNMEDGEPHVLIFPQPFREAFFYPPMAFVHMFIGPSLVVVPKLVVPSCGFCLLVSIGRSLL